MNDDELMFYKLAQMGYDQAIQDDGDGEEDEEQPSSFVDAHDVHRHYAHEASDDFFQEEEVYQQDNYTFNSSSSFQSLSSSHQNPRGFISHSSPARKQNMQRFQQQQLEQMPYFKNQHYKQNLYKDEEYGNYSSGCSSCSTGTLQELVEEEQTIEGEEDDNDYEKSVGSLELRKRAIYHSFARSDSASFTSSILMEQGKNKNGKKKRKRHRGRNSRDRQKRNIGRRTISDSTISSQQQQRRKHVSTSLSSRGMTITTRTTACRTPPPARRQSTSALLPGAYMMRGSNVTGRAPSFTATGERFHLFSMDGNLLVDEEEKSEVGERRGSEHRDNQCSEHSSTSHHGKMMLCQQLQQQQQHYAQRPTIDCIDRTASTEEEEDNNSTDDEEMILPPHGVMFLFWTVNPQLRCLILSVGSALITLIIILVVIVVLQQQSLSLSSNGDSSGIMDDEQQQQQQLSWRFFLEECQTSYAIHLPLSKYHLVYSQRYEQGLQILDQQGLRASLPTTITGKVDAQNEPATQMILPCTPQELALLSISLMDHNDEKGGDNVNGIDVRNNTFEVLPPFQDESDMTELFISRYSLAVLFFTMGGSEWFQSDKWLSSNHPCTWALVECGAGDGPPAVNEKNGKQQLFIKSLQLGSNNLRGSVPSELYLLTHLQHLNLRSNPIKGALSSNMSKLTNLRHLNLADTSITGSLPQNLFTALSKLTLLHLPFFKENKKRTTSALSPIPPSNWASLSNLVHLKIGSDCLNGTLPSGLGHLTSLQHVEFGGSLSGTLATELVALPLLQTLKVGLGSLSGTLPEEMFLNTLHWRKFDLSNNALSGTIPTAIGKLQSLTRFAFDFNQITGTIPTEIGSCTSLVDLFLSGNQVHGTIPREIGKMTGLKELKVYDTKLYGTLPTELTALTSLSKMEISDTSIVGSLSPNLCSFSPSFRLSLECSGGCGRPLEECRDLKCCFPL